MAVKALDAVDRLALRLLEEKDGLAVLGLCGAQGSGKSTLAQGLLARMGARSVASAILSIDDLYLTKAEREALAQDVHPLLRTRGVPGTHNVALGLRVLDALAAGRAACLPRFDKAVDDRLPESAWPEAGAGLRLLILEGWCVGARAQEAGALDAPVNALERDEDGDGRWRRFVNAALAGHYQALFGRIDALALLAAPGFDVVQGWRTQQEAALRAAGGGSAVMNDAEIARFIQHYERLTRHILDEMPARADLVVALDAKRGVTAVRSR
ncbi:kinase [Sphingobium yanoikuyae]|jgi:D-glycerate 3-kinase|uniref:kinase n=1 Tax=Sphingobium yanoikuyae TaxID=13690 RepID=UPI002FDE7B58